MARPWFETEWFKGLVVLGGAALLVGAFKLYMHQSQPRSERHETMGSLNWIPTNATVLSQDIYPNGFAPGSPSLPVASSIHLKVANCPPGIVVIPIEVDPGDGVFHPVELYQAVAWSDDYVFSVAPGYGPILHKPVIRFGHGEKALILSPTNLVELPPPHQLIDQTSVRRDPRIQAHRSGSNSVILTVRDKQALRPNNELRVTAWSFMDPPRPLKISRFSLEGTCRIEDQYLSDQRSVSVRLDHNPAHAIEFTGKIEGAKLETYSDGEVLEIPHPCSLRQGPWEIRIPAQARPAITIRVIQSFSLRVELYYLGKQIPFFGIVDLPRARTRVRPIAPISPGDAVESPIPKTVRPPMATAVSWRSVDDLAVRFDADTVSIHDEKKIGDSIEIAAMHGLSDAPAHAKIDAHDTADFGPLSVHIKGKAYEPKLLWSARIPLEPN